MQDKEQYGQLFSCEMNEVALLGKPFGEERKQDAKRKASEMESGEATCVMLQRMLTEQQAHIMSLNKHILSLTAEHRTELINYHDDRERLEKLIDELRADIAKTQQGKKKQRVTKTIKPKGDDSVGRIVKLEETVQKASALYTWSIVELGSERCNDLYGFSAQQIQSIYNCVQAISVDESKETRGTKSTIPKESFFLAFLHFFKCYPTLKDISVKFGIGKGYLCDKIAKSISDLSSHLFRASIEEESTVPARRRVFRSYFLPIQKPHEVAVAKTYYSTVYRTHGIYVYCIHDRDADGKVLEFYISTCSEVDEEWLGTHMNDDDDDIDDGVDMPYEERMKNKFSLAATRYRGALSDLPDVIECVLALTNFDIEYGNPVTEVITLQ